jgi:hypothetical protein
MMNLAESIASPQHAILDKPPSISSNRRHQGVLTFAQHDK